MKDWPENNECAGFEELINPLKDIMMVGYILKRREQTADYKYKGYRTFGNVMSPDGVFSKENLEYCLEDQGRDLLDAVLQVAFNLGMEQGKRDYKNHIIDPSITVGMLKLAIKNLECNT